MTLRRRDAGGVRVAGPAVTLRPVEAGGERLVVARPSPARRRSPLVLLLPGLFQEPGALYGAMYRLASGGAVAATFERTHPLGAAGPEDLAGRLEAWLEEGLRRARQVVDALAGVPGVDSGRIGLMGVSAGGWVALRLAESLGEQATAHEWSVAVAAVLSGPGWRRIPPAVADVLAEAGVRCPPDALGRPVDPARAPLLHPGQLDQRAERLRHCAVLLVGGGRDPVVDPEEVRAFYRAMAARRPEAAERLQLVLYPGLGHRLTPPMEARVLSWLLWMLQAGALRDG